MNRLGIDIAQVVRIMESLRAEVPELASDEELRLDTLEGCTEGVEVLRRIVRLMQEDDAFASGIDGYLDDIKTRRDRFVKRVEAYRSLIQRIMMAADLSKVSLPEATLSLRPGPPKVVIGAESEIPAEYFRHEIKPNLSAIKDALKAGETVPGASLSNGAPSLTVRTV